LSERSEAENPNLVETVKSKKKGDFLSAVNISSPLITSNLGSPLPLAPPTSPVTPNTAKEEKEPETKMEEPREPTKESMETPITTPFTDHYIFRTNCERDEERFSNSGKLFGI